jgi:hypothetical protein
MQSPEEAFFAERDRRLAANPSLPGELYPAGVTAIIEVS